MLWVWILRKTIHSRHKVRQMRPVEAEVAQSQTLDIQPVEQYDIVAEREKMNQLVGSEEVDKIASQIEVYNMDTIVTFGAEAAEEISKVSDAVLRNVNMSQLDESSQMMKSLAKIMGTFDADELKDDPNFSRSFSEMPKAG